MGTAELCTNCGASPNAGTSFCPRCGAPTTSATQVCSNCSEQVAKHIERKTWRTRIAGILAIVVGSLTLIQFLFVATLVIRSKGWVETIDILFEGGIAAVILAVVVVSAILAVVGGISALKAKEWGLALAGCICAIFSVVVIPLLLNVPLAIAAIVLVVLGKGEFK